MHIGLTYSSNMGNYIILIHAHAHKNTHLLLWLLITQGLMPFCVLTLNFTAESTMVVIIVIICIGNHNWVFPVPFYYLLPDTVGCRVRIGFLGHSLPALPFPYKEQNSFSFITLAHLLPLCLDWSIRLFLNPGLTLFQMKVVLC